MSNLPATFTHHRERLNEVAKVLGEYGFAAWVARGGRLVETKLAKEVADRRVDPELAGLTAGERLRRALIELGTTWIKFGQMLSLRPDVVGEDVAEELAKLQATVPADAPGLAAALVERELGAPVQELYGEFDAEPFASGSVAQVHRATLVDGTAVAVKVLHDGVERKVLEDLELMRAIAAYLEAEDAEIAQLRPTLLMSEFSQMMHDAIDLSEELTNLQRFTANFAAEPDIVFPAPYPNLSRRRVLTMSMINGTPFTDRASVEATGWDVETLVHRAADVYLEMIFRDSLYHADPHPGNFLLPDGTHMAILDFGDVGRLSSARKRQLESMVIAVGTQDVDSLVDVIVEMTTPSPSVDMTELRADIETWLNRYLLVGVGHLDMAAIMDTGMQLLRDNKLVLPADLALLFRVLLRLQGLGRGVDTDVRVTELLEPYVKKMLAERFNPRRLVRHVGRTARGWDHLAASLPGDIESILQQVRAGQLGVDFRIHDPDGAVDNLVDGLIASASVLAAAQLIARRSGPTIGPISAPGLIAAGVGVLTWQRLVRRRHAHRSWVTRASRDGGATAGCPGRMTAPGGVQLFAAGRDDPRARRPVDALHAAGWVFLLLLTCVLSVIGEDLDRRFGALLRDFPGFLHTLWRVGFWGAVAWGLALLVITAARGRLLLTGEAVLAAVAAVAGAAIAGEIVTSDGGGVLRQLVDTNGPPTFPHGAIAAVSAVLATMAPYLTRPLRRLGRSLIAAQLLGSLFLGATLATGAVASVLVGLLAGTAVLLLFGSPGAFPTISRVLDALTGFGLDASELHAVTLGRDGTALLIGRDQAGPIQVKVYGRDAWDSEFLASAWRSAWYRDGQRTARTRRVEYAEHEGFVTVLARQAGVRVPAVITAALADNGDALIVTRPDGEPILGAEAPLTPNQVSLLWSELRTLHGAGITHHRIDLDRVVVRIDGTAGFGDLASASVQCRAPDRLEDQAQLFALGIATSGEEVSVAQARAALGDEGLVEILPYVQEAAMPPHVRSALRHKRFDLDAVRKRLTTTLAAPETELALIRRVTWKSVLSIVLLAVAGYTVIAMLSDVDLGSFVDALGDADWWWLAAALVLGQLPRVANAVSSLGSTNEELPLGPTTLLQFAMCYLNLAIPSSAGRVAVTTRFYQRFGMPPAAAVSASVIDSASEIILQLVLFVLVFSISDVDLGLSLDTDKMSGVATTALIVLGVLLVAILAALCFPKTRAWIAEQRQEAHDALAVLRTPRKLLQLYGGNLVAQLLFAITLGATARAFGYPLPLSDLILVNTAVTLFAGLLPVPGGVGVMEAGLTLGLTRAGVPSDVAFPIALAYRFAVFYLPPIWGFVCFKWLTKHRYL